MPLDRSGRLRHTSEGDSSVKFDVASVIEIEAAHDEITKRIGPSAFVTGGATRPLPMQPQTLVAEVDPGSYDDPLLLPIYHYQLEASMGRKGVGREEACI
jgi:hypothetical protein